MQAWKAEKGKPHSSFRALKKSCSALLPRPNKHDFGSTECQHRQLHLQPPTSLAAACQRAAAKSSFFNVSEGYTSKIRQIFECRPPSPAPPLPPNQGSHLLSSGHWFCLSTLLQVHVITQNPKVCKSRRLARFHPGMTQFRPLRLLQT